MGRQTDYIMHTEFFSNFNRAILAAVVYNQVFQRVNPWQLMRKSLDRLWQGAFFVIAGDLDDQLQLKTSRRLRSGGMIEVITKVYHS